MKLRILFFLVSLGLLATAASAVSLRGEVTDAATGLPVEGALISMDGDEDYAARSGFFGFYSVSGAEAGGYVVTVTHPAYVDAVGIVSVVDGAPVTENFALTRKAGFEDYEPIDLHVEVRCVKSGVALSGVPVRMEVFGRPDEASPDTVYRVATDANGNVTVRGARRGYYRWAINEAPGAGSGVSRSQWLSYTTLGKPAQDLKLVDKSHVMAMGLKPVDQTLRITVMGLNPRLGAPTDPPGPPKPLEGHVVEVTGVEVVEVTAADGSTVEVVSEMTATRTRLTGKWGTAAFSDLPAIAYKVVLKRAGYAPLETILEPDPATGDLLGNGGTAPEKILVEYVPHLLLVRGLVPYMEPGVLAHVDFVLTGMEGTNTEGIERTLGLDPFFPDDVMARSFDGLLPGFYEVMVDGKSGEGNPMATKPHFVGLGTFELPLVTDPFFPEPHEVDLPLGIKPASVRVRLFGSDEVSLLPGDFGNPIYRPKWTEFIAFGEHRAGAIIGPAGTVVVDPDPRGEGTAFFLPGRYGVKLPDLPDYWGSHVLVRNVTDGTEWEQGWAYVEDWPYPGEPPKNGTAKDGDPLVFESGKEYEIDLFVRKQEVTVEVGVAPDPGSPAEVQVFVAGEAAGAAPPGGATLPFGASSVDNDGVVSLVPAGGGAPRFDALKRVSDTEATARFLDVDPGDYLLTAMHPRYTMTHAGGGSVGVTVPSWGFPGEIPSSDPGAAGYLVPQSTIKLPGGAVTASYDSPPGRSITIDRKEWDDDDGWVTVSSSTYTTTVPFPYIKLGHEDDLLFYNSGTVKMPSGAFTFWFEDSGNWHWGIMGGGSMAETFEVLRPGNGMAGNPVAGPVPPATKVVLRAVNFDDATHEPEGTTFVGLPGSPLAPGAEFTVEGLPEVTAANVSNGKWSVIGEPKIVLTDPSIPRFTATATLRKGGLKVTGTARQLHGGAPVAGVTVVALNRWGHYLSKTTTKADDAETAEVNEAGTFGFDGVGGNPGILPLGGVVYLDLRAPGFHPLLLRLDPDSPEITAGEDKDDPLSYSGDFLMIPLPTPAFHTTGRPGSTMIDMDRYGMFVPRLRKATKDFPIFSAFDEEAVLVCAWSAVIEKAAYLHATPSFDSDTGAESSPPPEAIVDELHEVWLIDSKGFEGDPLTSIVHDIPAPDLTDPVAKRKWLENIRDGFYIPEEGGAALRVFLRKAEFVGDEEGEAPPGFMRASGSLKLWELPPGEFRPRLVVQTKRGAVLVTEPIDYNLEDNVGFEANYMLQGAYLPEYLADALNILGSVAQVPAKRDTVKGIFPKGKFESLGTFTGKISVSEDPKPEGFITYEYGIGVNLLEGQESPGGKMMGLASKRMGASADVEVKLTIKGFEKEAIFSGGGKVTTETQLQQKQYVPGATASYAPQITVVPQLDWAVSNSERLSEEDPVQSKVQFEVGGGVGVFTRVNLRPLTGKIPYAGFVFEALDRTNAMNLYGDLTGGGKIISKTSWTTERPVFDFAAGTRESGTGSVGVDPGDAPYEPQFGFMGGKTLPEETGFSQDVTFLIHVGLGITAKILAGQVEGTVGLRLVGDNEENTITFRKPPNQMLNEKGEQIKLEAAELTVNLVGDGPWIKKIAFFIQPFAEATLHTPIKNIEKKAKFPKFEFIHHQNTEPDFVLLPIDLEVTVTSFDEMEPVTFTGVTPQLVRGCLPVGSYATGGGGLVFLDRDVVTGEMVLKFSARAGLGAWGAPVAVASAGAIADMMVVPAPGGGWLAAWSEIATEDLGDPFAAETVMYATGDAAGTVWSAPAVAYSGTGLARELRWAETPGSGALVFLEGGSGPESSEFGISLLPWTGAAFGAAVEVRAAGELGGFDAAGDGLVAGGRSVVAFTDGDGVLSAVTWDGVSVSAETVLAANGSGAIDVATHDGVFGAYLFWGADDGAVRGAGLAPDGSWTPAVDLANGVSASEIEGVLLDDPVDGDVMFLSWLAGSGQNAEVEGGYFGLDGSVLVAPVSLSGRVAGSYSDIGLVPLGGRSVEVLAKHVRDDSQLGHELRSFHMTFAHGVSVGNDRDGDGLNDLSELRIVDEVFGDGLEVIDDVLPDGDPDGDGFTTAEELAAGSSPIDPTSVPGSAGVSVVAVVAEAYEEGNRSGEFEVRRPDGDDASVALEVNYEVGGTASGVDDYATLSGVVTIPVGQASATLFVEPITDDESEGTETVVVRVAPGAGYSVGAPGGATVEIRDRAMDQWRFENFAALRNDPLVAGELADIDGDGATTLWEYFTLTGPLVPGTDGVPSSTFEEVAPGATHLEVSYRRNVGATELAVRVEMSDDLDTWVPATFDGVSTTTNGDGTETVRLRSRAPVEEDGEVFVRVGVER